MATTTSELTPGSVFAILLSLALVGGATIYYIKKREERRLAPHEHREHHPHALPPPPQQRTPATTPPPATYTPPSMLPHAPPPPPSPPPHDAPHQYTQPSISADDASRALAQVAAMLRAPWQHGVDDITVLQTAIQNPSLPSDQRAMAQEVLSAAHVHAHAHARHRQPQTRRPAPPPPPPPQDVGHAQPWQDFSRGVAQMSDWVRDVMQPPPHAQPPAPPVTYAPHVMPSLEHPPVAPPSAHDLSRPPLPEPGTSWVEAAKAIGLIKPGDPRLSVQEAQHYINMLTTGAIKLVEDGVWGPKTFEALQAFQLAHHLPMTGTLDAETSAALLYAGLAQH